MSDRLPHDGVPDLLGAYALDAVDPAERAQVEAHLAECPRCRAEVEEHREVAALLANVGRPAPEGLWDRIVESLEHPPPPLNLVPSRDNPVATVRPRVVRAGGRRPRVVRAAALTALAAAAAVVIVALGLRVDHLQGDLDRIDAAIQARLTEGADPEVPGGSVVDLTAPDPDVSGVQAVITSDGKGFLATGNLPVLDPGQTYQLWGDTGDRVISLGVLGRDPEPVETFDAGGDFVAFALTAEEAPGVVTSTQAPVAAGQVTS